MGGDLQSCEAARLSPLSQGLQCGLLDLAALAALHLESTDGKAVLLHDPESHRLEQGCTDVQQTVLRSSSVSLWHGEAGISCVSFAGDTTATQRFAHTI